MALYFFNYTGQTVWVAFAYYDPSCGAANQNFRKQGWWQLEPSHGPFQPYQPFNAWNVDLRTVNRFAYFYAEAADGSNWSGTGNSWLSVNPAAPFKQCAFEGADDSQWVDFYGLDFSLTFADFDTVVNLFEWGVPTLLQYPGLPRVQVNAVSHDTLQAIIGLGEPG